MEKLNIMANKAEIEAALHSVNGKATKHAFTSFYDITRCEVCAEENLESLKLPKALRAGATWVATSGAPVANSYDNKRTGTRITLERAKTGWVLTGVERVELYKEGGGVGKLALTRAQYDEAAKRLMAGVSIIADGAGE